MVLDRGLQHDKQTFKRTISKYFLFKGNKIRQKITVAVTLSSIAGIEGAKKEMFIQY